MNAAFSTASTNAQTDARETQNPLVRDGAAQPQRQTRALQPDYVQVDEKDLADFLIFAHDLSCRIHYTNIENQPDGDWQAFFERSAAVQIARISKTQPDTRRDQYDKALNELLDAWHFPENTFSENATEDLSQTVADSDSPVADLSTQLASLETLFNVYTQLLKDLQTWYWGLADGSDLKATFRAIVTTNLPAPLKSLYRLEHSLIQNGLPEAVSRLAVYQKVVETFGSQVLPAIESRALVKGRDLEAIAQQISQLLVNPATARVELDGIFQPIFQTYRQIIALAPEALSQSLYGDQQLPYHLALYVTFWEVLKPAIADLNRMTQRHLDFFYKQVLRLQQQPAVPDKAHIVFELEKLQQAHLVERQSQLSAGADATGVDLIYTLDEEILVNTAQVAELKGLFVNRAADSSILGIHASPVANSFDGTGGDFPKDRALTAWLPFGDENRPTVAIGLAIANDIFLLKEGDRNLTFTFSLTGPPQQAPITDLTGENIPALQVELSGETDWIRGTIQQLSLTPATQQANNTEYTLTLTVNLPIATEAVVPYHSDLPGGTLTTHQPVARLVLHPQPTSASELVTDLAANPVTTGLTTGPTAVDRLYQQLYQAQLTALTITTTVTGVRSLLLQNDLAVLEAAQPFAPFGPQPKAGANFYIGSQEAFQKSLTALKLSFDMETAIPADWVAYYAGYEVDEGFHPGITTVQALKDRQWQPTDGFTKDLFSPSSQADAAFDHTFDHSIVLSLSEISALKLNSHVQQPENTAPMEPWSYKSQYGFLRFQLTGDDFRHAAYPQTLTRQVLAIATDPTASKTLPKEPYTPVIKALQLDYTAKSDQTSCQFFHLHPFDGVNALPKAATVALLPQFEYEESLIEADQKQIEGQLLIGFQNLEPLTTLSLLFQVVSETADTDLARTPVSWHYLIDNTWHPFEDHQILQDQSNGLIQSGIVKLAIPANIRRLHTTLLNPDLHWIRASVNARSRAIGHILSIQTQAAKVTFVEAETGNDPRHLAQPLPAKSIADFVDPPPEIKQIQQPYPSFGGQTQETSTHFYTRISEHLRHKGRAVNIFDYEHLVLNQFPDIYKVRCINHGQLNEAALLREVSPGYVTLAVIPSLAGLPSFNNLKPKVNINRLADIERYLQAQSSPWAGIQVVNPQYEEIRVSFQVMLQADYFANAAFYRRKLERDIISYLSPWTVDSEAEIHFGGEIYRSSILKFVEDQPYVDYVLEFQLFQAADSRPRVRVAAPTAHSILVSAPFSDDVMANGPSAGSNTVGHHITLLDPKDKLPIIPSAEQQKNRNTLGYSPLSRLTLGE